jgi:mRNA interferase MazF
VVPITSERKPARSWHVKVKSTASNSLKKDSLIDTFQLKSVSSQRFIRKIGVLSQKEMDDLKVTVAEVLDLL